MRIGTLDNRVTLYHRVLTQDATTGQEVESWPTSYSECWAKRNDVKGREYFASQGMHAELGAEFTLRWRTDVLLTDRIVESGLAFNIRHIAEIPRHKGLIIMATAVQPT